MYHFLKIRRATAFALIVQSSLTSLVAEALTVSKEQAVVRALQQNPALNAARTTIDRAEGNRQQAGRWANPELSIDYATDRTFNDEGEYGYSVGFEQRFPVTNRLRLQKSIAHCVAPCGMILSLGWQRACVILVGFAQTQAPPPVRVLASISRSSGYCTA